MPSSNIAIANMALSHIGVTTTIAALTEASKEARACNRFLEHVRDTLLEVHDWGFARQRVALALTTDAVNNWQYVYQYPVDCMVARRITSPGLRVLRADQRIPFESASDGARRLLMADLQDAELVYTMRITDPNLFPASFVDLVAKTLAAYIAMPLAVSTSISQSVSNSAQNALDMAIAADLRDGQEDQPPEPDLLAARA